MNSLNEINNKLKYTEFYNLPDKTWIDSYFYPTILNELVNDYDFLNTFKDKIKWTYLFYYHNINQSITECFIDYYNEHTWQWIWNSQNYNMDFVNKYYTYIKFPMCIQLFYTKHKAELYEELSPIAMDYLLKQGYDFINY